MAFHDKLQSLRKGKGLSQEELAEMLGVSRQAVSKWESGTSFPEMDKMIALGDIFGVTLDSLVKGGGTDTEKPAEPVWVVRRYHYEYKSKRVLFGLPLVHVNVGAGMRRAKGVIAIGNIATGIVSIGLVAMGLVSFGLLGLGLLLSLSLFALSAVLAVGSVAAGFFAVGAVALGYVTLGALSVGVYSLGACAVGARLAVGDHAYGAVAVGRVARGTITFLDTSASRDFSEIASAKVRQAVFSQFPDAWAWAVRLITAVLP